MSRIVFDMIRRGQTAELAAELADHAHLAAAQDAQGVSALRMAIYSGQPAMRDLLLPYLPDLDIFDAACVGELERLEQLLTTDPSLAAAYSGDGWTPLHLAAAFAGHETVQLLIEKGADVHARSKNPLRNQPLHACIALHGALPSVRVLVASGAEVNATQVGGYTPLHQAAAAGKLDVVQFLLENGASPATRTEDGKLPADYARERGHSGAAELLSAAA